MFPLEEMLDVQLLMRDKRTYRTANIFGFIAYTDRNPFLVKVLRDDDYWRSLNERTKGWLLYAVKPNSQYYIGGNAQFINESFGLEPDDYPQLVILSVGTNGVMMQRCYSLSDDSVESAYKSIERNVDIITRAVKNILPAFKDSTNVSREVLKALDAELTNKKWKKVAAALFPFIQSLI